MKTYKGDTFADVYKEALKDVYYNPQYETSPRGQKVKEVCNVSLEFDPKYSLYENQKRGSQHKYISGEFIWYFMGHNDIDFISRYSKFWKTLDNGDGTVNSAYGNLLFAKCNEHGHTQWEWALESLKKDKDSRQAIIHFNNPSHQWFGNKDFVCTLNGIFQIRNNNLNFTVNMRSNDLILGTPTDVAFFCILQQQMLNHLKKTYPKLKLGTYTHNVHSLHLYERNFNTVETMLKYDFNSVHLLLNEDLINDNSLPSTELVEIYKSVIESKHLEKPKFNDVLLDWISENA